MTILLTLLHITVCLALIAIVLLQGGKGAEMGASFGAGGSNTVFGAAGGQSFMGKLTTAAAVIFMLTSLTLTYFAGQADTDSVMPASVVTTVPQADQLPVAAEPAKQQAAPAPAAPAPTAETAPAAEKK